MWRRHPNLFGEGRAGRADHAGWELVKRREPRAGGKRGTLAGLPPTLPPLLMRIGSRSALRASGSIGRYQRSDGKGEGGDQEVERETGNGRRETIEAEIGDLLFAAVNLARKHGIEAVRRSSAPI